MRAPTHTPPLIPRWRFVPLGSAALAVAFGAMPVPAGAESSPIFTAGEPDGFADLSAEQTLLVDVYFGGVRRGEAKVVAKPGALRIADVPGLLDLLPELVDRAAIEQALNKSELPAHTEHACAGNADRSTCGRLFPELAEVILDRARLRLDVFLNPRFLSVSENVGERYLPAPTEELSMIDAFGVLASGGSGAGSERYNVQNQFVVAHGTRRVRADLSLDSDFGFEADRVVFEWDRPELRYSAGAFWSRGDELSGRYKLIGLGVETQIDTRRDKEEIVGSPIVAYLDSRARVDLIRDGHVLHSAMYEAGNQQIDTSNLPDGSYQVTVLIQEPGRPSREERRFFSKSRRIPALGRADFFALGGLLVDGLDHGSLRPSRRPVVQAGAAFRLSRSVAVEGMIQGTGEGGSAQLVTTFLTPLAQLRIGAIVDLEGRYGGVVQVASSGTSRLNVNFDLRHVESNTSNPLAPGSLLSGQGAVPGLAWLGESFSQASGVLSYSIADFRFLAVGTYREEETRPSSYSIGPSIQWDFLRKGPLMLTFRADMTATDRGSAQFAGVALRLLGARTSVTALGGGRTSTIDDDDIGEGAVASLGGSWNAAVAGGQLTLGAGLDHSPRQEATVLSTEFRHAIGSVAGDFVRNDRDQGPAVSQYSLGLQTTVAVGAGGVEVAGKTTTEGMIIAKVDGAQKRDRFEVLVNEQLAGTIIGSEPLILSLPTYRAYQLRIRPTGEGLLAYDSSPRSVGLYPGAVTRLEWAVQPITIKFGRLVDFDGRPVAHASLIGKDVWSVTDDEGFFQIEAPDDFALTVTLRDGRSFAATLPAGEAKGGVAKLGAIICCERDGVRLGVQNPDGHKWKGPTK